MEARRRRGGSARWRIEEAVAWAALGQMVRVPRHLAGRETELGDFFRTGIPGFGPEVSEEPGGPLCLDHDLVNRQLVLLGMGQKSSWLVDAAFAPRRGVLRQVTGKNAPGLLVLAARGVVAGGLVNTVPGMGIGEHFAKSER